MKFNALIIAGVTIVMLWVFGALFDSAMADGFMTDTDIYAMEKVIASRNNLSI